MELTNSKNEKYRAIADYNQTVVPVAIAIEDVDWVAFERLVCDAYRQDAAREIKRAWKETNGTRTGQLIRRYEDAGILKAVNDSCEAGRPWEETTKRLSGGADTVRMLRERQRKAQIPKAFGAEECKQLIAGFRNKMRISWLAQYEALRTKQVTPRLFLAERLKHSSTIARLDLPKAVEYKAGQYLWPKQVGDLLGSIDYFRLCWREFHEAEQAPAATTQPLDTPAPSSPRPEQVPAAPPMSDAGAVGGAATEWKDLLQMAAKRFTLDDLDMLLAKVGLLNDAASRTPTDDFRGAALAGIIKALRERKYLKRSNTAKVAALLADRYGRDVANPNTIGRRYDPLSTPAQAIYTCALAFLPAP